MANRNIVDPKLDEGIFIDCSAFANDPGITRAKRLPRSQTILRLYPHLVVRDPSPNYQRIFITHRWDSKSHPDPTGWQRDMLRRYCQYLTRTSSSNAEKWCFWYDYMSLPQKPRRSPADKELFKRGLRQVQRLTAESWNCLLVSRDGPTKKESFDRALKRGWVLVEQFFSRANQRTKAVIFEGDFLSLIDGPKPWSGVIPDLRHLVPAESPALILQWFKAKKIECTNGSDLSLLAAILHDHLGRVDYSLPPPGLRFNQVKTATPAEMARYQVAAGAAVSSLFPNVYFDNLLYHQGVGYRRRPFSFKPVPRPKLPVIGDWTFYSDDDFRRFRVDPKTRRSPMYPGIRFYVRAINSRRGQLVRIKVG